MLVLVNPQFPNRVPVDAILFRFGLHQPFLIVIYKRFCIAEKVGKNFNVIAFYNFCHYLVSFTLNRRLNSDCAKSNASRCPIR